MQKSGSKAVTTKTAAKAATTVKQETAAVKPAEKVVEEVKKAAPVKPAEKAAEEVKKPAAAVKPVEKQAEEVKQETLVFDNTSVTEEKKEAENKATVKKEAAKKTMSKKTTRKPAVKAVEKIEEVYVQFEGQEFFTKEIMERAKQAYIAEGHRESSIKSIRLYIKPEEHMAYYVINEKIAGGVPV